jgi:hypothetical protein
MPAARAAQDPLETVEVTGSRAQVRKQVETFVSEVTRADGDAIGRWGMVTCPLVAGLSDPQADFLRHRLIEIQDEVRKSTTDLSKPCKPNLFVIVTEDPDGLMAEWKEKDPGMFRWKTREGVSRYAGSGPVRVWHNATEDPSDGGPVTTFSAAGRTMARGRLVASNIKASVAENIQAVVVLVDARGTHGTTLAQLTDYVAMVSLAKIDLDAKLAGIDTILQLFADPRPPNMPQALTAWDFAFLHGLYRISYMPKNQHMDLRARMVRELAPR